VARRPARHAGAGGVRWAGARAHADVESVTAAPGWDLRVAADVHETATPTPEEIAIVRACDADAFWTR